MYSAVAFGRLCAIVNGVRADVLGDAMEAYATGTIASEAEDGTEVTALEVALARLTPEERQLIAAFNDAILTGTHPDVIQMIAEAEVADRVPSDITQWGPERLAELLGEILHDIR